MWKKFLHLIRSAAELLVWLICICIPISKNKLVVVSYYGRGYGDNAKYIVDEILKKKSDIKYRMSQQQIEELVQLQRAILKNAADYVKSGGTLIYSTCTIAKEENDLQVDWILENLPLQLVSLRDCLCEEVLENADREGVLQLLPGREKTDGFFLAKFQKK